MVNLNRISDGAIFIVGLVALFVFFYTATRTAHEYTVISTSSSKIEVYYAYFYFTAFLCASIFLFFVLAFVVFVLTGRNTPIPMEIGMTPYASGDQIAAAETPSYWGDRDTCAYVPVRVQSITDDGMVKMVNLTNNSEMQLVLSRLVENKSLYYMSFVSENIKFPDNPVALNARDPRICVIMAAGSGDVGETEGEEEEEKEDNELEQLD